MGHGQHKVGGRRLIVDFVSPTTDLSLTARAFTRPKDYAVWHEVVRTITTHLIDRYGEATLEFLWSTFNEPDIVGEYWRHHWDEAQRYYDYTVDAVLRAFEDRGYDSNRVLVGGWELGAIFGANLRLNEVFAHCSPRAEYKGALSQNAAFIDPRLDGKRSRRVEELCRAHDGKGSPLDFVSVHTYGRSELTAAKLIRAKEMALELDAEYYEDLWVNTFESCPDWAPPPDEGSADSYLGNGYFSSWCMDVAQRLLQQATSDTRYNRGESVITIWPPPTGFSGINTLALRLPMDDSGDGISDRMVTVPTPIFYSLTLLSDLGPHYWVLPSKQIGAHVVGGFASCDEQSVVRVALYNHHAEDVQSRSKQSFRINLALEHIPIEGPLRVTEYRFDRNHNSYFHEAVALRHGPDAGEFDPQEVEAIKKILEEGDAATVKEALKRIEKISTPALIAIAPSFLRMTERILDADVLKEARKLIKSLFAATAAKRPGYPRETIEKVRKLAELQPTASTTFAPDANGTLRLTIQLLGNGANLIVIEPANKASR